MAAEFYHKTAALFEEFKKRELISLNYEKELDSSLNWKNDLSLSTQEYLKKINQRERETEKTYKEIMRNMEDLDRQTDQMSLKLEKLHALRNIAISSNSTAWPSVDDTFDRPLQSYYQKSLTNNADLKILPSKPVHPFHSLPIEPYSSKFHSSDKSTQTEYLFCGQCHFPVTILSTQVSETVKLGTSSLDAPLQERNPAVQNQSAALSSLLNDEEGNKIQDMGVLKEHNSVQPTLSEDLLEKSPQKAVMKSNFKFNSAPERNEEMVKDLKHLGKDAILMESLEECSESIEQPTLKSDDESINHEFDFLESNKRSSVRSNTVPKVSFQNNVEEFCSSDDISEQNVASEKISSNLPVFDNQAPSSPEKSHQQYSSKMERIKVDEDVKPDSSVSGGHPTPPFHSENASLASESDTSSDKDTPLTATAAYQALLGNASSSRSSQKKLSIPDSDSEDEIEKALATTSRRISIVQSDPSEPPLKPGGRKESVAEIKPKPEARGSISSNKPLSNLKMSKNTRKVLGLDTSSGSEMELTVAPNTSKKDEDSDEFDFYD